VTYSGRPEARRQRSHQRNAQGKLRGELAEVEARIARFMEWIGKGRLVDDLESQMMAAEARRDYLRRELARARSAEMPDGIAMLPTAVRKIVSDLRQMLEAGRVEDLKRILSRLITSIEVHEDPRPGQKRPGARLVVRGSLEALGQLTRNVTSANSPGPLLAILLVVEQPVVEVVLRKRERAVPRSRDTSRIVTASATAPTASRRQRLRDGITSAARMLLLRTPPSGPW